MQSPTTECRGQTLDRAASAAQKDQPSSASCSAFLRAVKDRSCHVQPQCRPTDLFASAHLHTKASDRLNVSPGTIRTYITDGKLRGYKIGRLIKVDVKELDALVVTVDNS